VGLTPADAEAFRARLAAGEFGRWDRLGDLAGDLGPEATTSFLLQSRQAQELPQVRGAVHESIELRVHLSPAGRLTVAILAKDVALRSPSLPILEGLTPPEPPDFPRTVFRTTALLSAVEEDAEEGRHAVTVIARSPFDEHGGAVFAAVIEVEPGPAFPRSGEGPDPAGTIEAVVQRLLRGLEAEEPAVSRTGSGLEAALPGLGRPAEQRATLVYLARETGAKMAGDTALSFHDASIAGLAERVAAALKELARPLDPAAVGWVLERESLLVCLDAVETEGDDLTLGLLLAYAGDVGRYPGDLRTVVLGAGDLPALEEALVSQNLLHLEDNSPASRVRAFDWLLLREKTPAGYDPLGSREARRKALEAVVDSELEDPGP
jgi:hypothetical protein